MIYAQLGMPQGAEWIVILAIVILVFGAAKLPELARSSGQALRIFKTETKGLIDGDEDDADDDKPAPPPQATRELPSTESGTTSSEAGNPETHTERHPG